MSFPPIILLADLRNVHPWIKSLFSARIDPNFLLTGRFKYFFVSMANSHKRPKHFRNCEEVQGILSQNSTQEKVPQTPYMSQEQAALVQAEIESMLKMAANTDRASG